MDTTKHFRRHRPDFDKRVLAAIEKLRLCIVDTMSETDEIQEIEVMTWKLKRMIPVEKR